jgi:N-acetylmuramoyl-L-alanine amidase
MGTIPRLWLCFCLLGLPASLAGTGRHPSPLRASEERVALPGVADRYGLSLVATGKIVTLRSPLASITLESDSRQMRFNGTMIWLNDGTRFTGGRWSISEGDATAVLKPLLDPKSAPPIPAPASVVLDPGHRGDDTGARSPGRLLEKDLNLTIALLVAERMRASGTAVWLTREKDKELSLPARPQTAERTHADLFVSVHMNSATNAAVAGVETYLLPATGFNSTMGRSRDTDRAPGNRYDAASQLLAYDVHRAIQAGAEAQDRGVRRARFDVLTLAPCPAILVECGFLSNTREASLLATAEYQGKIADGIAKGIKDYLSRCEAEARRREPAPLPKPEVSNPGTDQTNRTDHAVLVPPPDGTAH